MIPSLKQFTILCMLSILLSSCIGRSSVAKPATPAGQTDIPQETSTPAESATEAPFVIERPQFAAAVNPLTGLSVQDPSLLELPAALVSITHFPVEARPQFGLSYAPWVFEVYITEGATRFLATFYGEFPAPEPYLTGGCDVRTSPLTQTDNLLGNRVWLDTNQNHLQDDWEDGVGGVCVNLYDANQNLLQQTTTDSNGYYAFNVPAGNYFVAVVKPEGMEFDQQDAGDESQDSDVDQATGRSEVVQVNSTSLNLDAGLTLLKEPNLTSELAPAYVGPVRSGRLVYADIANFFPGSCLIFAYASSEVLPELPTCAFVEHILFGGGYLLDIEKMKGLVEQRRNPQTSELYSSNTFSADVPEGGVPANRLDVYFAWLNQSAWAYDAASQSWWRYVDNADPDTAGLVHPEVDRLNGRQLKSENVIVLFAYHDVISPTNLEIHLEQDWVGDALLFRDGQMYKVRWSTIASNQEVDSGTRRPIQFFYPDEKTPFPLKPGHTWITVVTPLTAVTETSSGNWLLQFSQPVGAQ